MSLLDVRQLTVRLDGSTILSDVSFSVERGTWVGLVGPNGSGKTTLLRALGAHIPFDGEVRLDGRPVAAWTAAERARRLAHVRQAPTLPFDFTVEDLVLLGRAPHRSWLQAYDKSDREQVRAALARVDLDGFEKRSVLSLSGGETQRVFLAQALVQNADLLLLDEPTAHLDVRYQYSFMQQVAAQVEAGRAILAVFHDLELAVRHADRLLVLHRGRLWADGAPRDVLTPACIAEVFGMRARVTEQPDGTPRIDYRGPVDSNPTRQTTDFSAPSAKIS